MNLNYSSHPKSLWLVAFLLSSWFGPCADGFVFFRTQMQYQSVPLYRDLSRVKGADTDEAVNGSNSQSPAGESKVRFRDRLASLRGRIRQGKQTKSEKTDTTPIFEIDSLPDLESYFADEAHLFRDEDGIIDYDRLIKSLDVKGNTQVIGSKNRPDYVHPVAKLIHERKMSQSTCGHREDGKKLALVVEGGGMRGCVSAGMVCALHHLGLRETVDVVYGSSAGSIIGAYFITGQLPWFGPELYYDKLTTAGNEFIDTKRLLRSLGVGLVDPRLLKDVVTRPNNGKPVLNLPFLLEKTMQKTKPLDWDHFVERQAVQPLKVVASGLKSEEPVVMDMEHKDFQSISELSTSMRASCLLPGIAGPVVNIKRRGDDTAGPQFVIRNNFDDPRYEPLGDALIYAPLPFKIAKEEGATHVLVIRSRPDGTDVTGKGGVFERLISRRFFVRKNKLPKMFQRMSQHLHKKLYAESVIELNNAADSDQHFMDNSTTHLLTMALPPGSEEVTRLETGREAIFEGVRRGFARAYDALVEDPNERGRGHIVAKQYFPDEILNYDPRNIHRTDDSAFGVFMEENDISPKSWSDGFHIQN